MQCLPARSFWLVGLLLSLLLVGCASTPETQEGAEPSETEQADAEAAPLDDPMLDGVFVVPGVDFSGYGSLLVPALNLEQWRPAGRELPLKELNRNDRQFFRQSYTESLVHTLVMNGDYALAVSPGADVLEVRGQLRQSVQAAEEGASSSPRGTIVMLLTLDLYDSESGDLVATMTSRQPIDRSLNERNSPLTGMQVQRAFLEWMRWFREELDSLRQ